MDALSSLLEEVHLREAKYYYIHGHGHWRFFLSPPEYMMAFYVVLSGTFTIGIDNTMVCASAGDMLMLPQSKPHHCFKQGNFEHQGFEPKSFEPRSDACDLLKNLPKNSDEPIQLGNGFINSQVILVLCEYDQDMAKPLLSALPSILPEKSTNQPLGGKTIPMHTINTGFTQHFDIHSEVLKIGLSYLAVETRVDRLGKSTMLNRLISMLMVECLREYIESLEKTSDSWLLALKDAQLAKAIGVMHAQPEKNWSINSLAEVAGMSRSSFAERFKLVVGQPPLGYLTSYRLRLAARFLRLEQYSIGRISELVGYASDSTFSQAFKRAYQVSPMQYRQKFVHQDGCTKT